MQISYLNTSYKTSGMIDDIKPGDLCIVQDNGLLYFVVANENFKEQYHSGSIQSIFDLTFDQELYSSDGVLYKFDGVTSRKGNRTLINTLLSLSLCDELRAFFEDIIQILLYKEHKLNIQNLMALYSFKSSCVSLNCLPEREALHDHLHPELSSSSEQNDKTKTIQQETTSSSPVKPQVRIILESYEPDQYIFYDYLSDDYKQLWNKLFQEGKNTRECLSEIKRINKNCFNAVLSKFKKDNPTENIYTLK